MASHSSEVNFTKNYTLLYLFFTFRVTSSIFVTSVTAYIITRFQLHNIVVMDTIQCAISNPKKNDIFGGRTIEAYPSVTLVSSGHRHGTHTPAPVAQWRKSLAAVHLACVAERSGFNSRLRRLVGTCRSTKFIFRD